MANIPYDVRIQEVDFLIGKVTIAPVFKHMWYKHDKPSRKPVFNACCQCVGSLNREIL